MVLNEIDKKLIQLVQMDSRASYGELGAAVGLSVSAVNERLKKLQTQQIIQGWRAQINAKAIGLEVLAFIYSIPQFFVLDGEKKIWLTMQEISRTTETALVFA